MPAEQTLALQRLRYVFQKHHMQKPKASQKNQIISEHVRVIKLNTTRIREEVLINTLDINYMLWIQQIILCHMYF